MDEPQNDECIICRSYYRDPYFCSDGWSYCKECITKWTNTSGIPWKSPFTNKLIYSSPLLVRDEKRHCLSLEHLHYQLSVELSHCSMKGALRVCADLGLAITENEIYDVLCCCMQSTETMTVDEFWIAVSICQSLPDCILSVIARSGLTLWDALKEDLSSSRRPLVEMTTLTLLTRCACEAANFEFALPLLSHLCRRSAFCDAIAIPPQQPKSRYEGRYERCTHSMSSEATVFVNSRTAAHLTIPHDGSPATVQTTTGERFVFPARKGTLPFNTDWVARRGPGATTVFPDNSCDEGTVSDWTCPVECTVFEQSIAYIPPGTKYIPFAQREVSQSGLHADLLEILCNSSAVASSQTPPVSQDHGSSKRRRRRN